MRHNIGFNRVYIEITNICNKSCSFCPKTKRAAKFLTVKEFEHIIAQIKPLTNNLCLHVMGEPLMHPYLDEILSICDQNKMSVNLVTNGSLLGVKTGILIRHPSIRKVTVSLHSFEANAMTEQLSGYVNSCLSAADLIAHSNKFCELRLWNFDSGEKSGKNQLNEDIISLINKHFNLSLNPLDVVEKRNITLSQNIFLGTDEIFDWPNEETTKETEQGFCYGLRTHFGILSDGTVIPCCLDNNGTINLGNIFTQNINEILSAPRAKAIYDGFTDRKPCENLCKHCGYSKRFQTKK